MEGESGYRENIEIWSGEIGRVMYAAINLYFGLVILSKILIQRINHDRSRRCESIGEQMIDMAVLAGYAELLSKPAEDVL